MASVNLSDSDSEEERPMFGGNTGMMGSFVQSNKHKMETTESEGVHLDEPPLKKAKRDKGSSYTEKAKRMMALMGYQAGKGLGKNQQGRTEIVEASKQKGRRGLGLHLAALEPDEDADWDFEAESITIDETVDWLPHCDEAVPDMETLRDWKVIGPKKRTIDDETRFCDEDVVKGILNSKSVFDQLESEEMRRARTKSNPYETIRGVFFQNRAAMKMANMDAVLDFMFTKPETVDGKSLINPGELLYFADVCAGPGGFSEYILWRTKGDAKGFGMTLKGACDFKLEEFFAGPAEMFEPHYGVGGMGGDGDIFNPNNQAEFIKFVHESTEGLGVHFVMADGGFSVEGQENIQEILSKQLYLCQFLVAISIIRTGGHFVCKLFDLFTPFSMGLIYLMYRIFDRVSIFKPVTSRPANSERYIVCRNLREDREPVRQYMHEINLDLNKFMSTTSVTDVNEIVPHSVLEDDGEFFQYMYESNVLLGRLQITSLKKIQTFTQNSDLYEGRQSNIRQQCLERWQVPDEVRSAPSKEDPSRKFKELTQDDDEDFFEQSVEHLTHESLAAIKTPYDYRCYVVGGLERKRWYILGLGRSHVFKWDGNPKVKWRKLDENMRIELPNKTLIEVEFVQELKGEGMGQKRLMTLHALDALYLYGKDVRSLHFNERIEKLKRFVKSINKPTRTDLVQIVVPNIFRLEHIEQIFERLAMKKVKGSSQPRLCYSPPDRPDGRSFLPTGVCFVKTCKDPWTIALSRSQGRKYFYNLFTRESKFEIPRESIATVRDTKLNTCWWVWEEGVKIHDSQMFRPDPDKVSRDDLIGAIHGLLEKLTGQR